MSLLLLFFFSSFFIVSTFATNSTVLLTIQISPTLVANVTIVVVSEWAPIGAARFLDLVNAMYYDDCYMYRVVPGYIAQFGIAADPSVSAIWRYSKIIDDPSYAPNVKGTLVFATSGANSRTTQVFFNLAHNLYLNKQYPPFAIVVDGMNSLDLFYGGYNSAAVMQTQMFSVGNQYIENNFPLLSKIISARVVQTATTATMTTAATTATTTAAATTIANATMPDTSASDTTTTTTTLTTTPVKTSYIKSSPILRPTTSTTTITTTPTSSTITSTTPIISTSPIQLQVFGNINNNLTIFLFDQIGATSATLSISPSIGSLYQVVNNTRIGSLMQKGDSIQDPQGRIVFIPNNGESASPYDSFGVKAVPSGVFVVTVNIVSSSSSPPPGRAKIQSSIKLWGIQYTAFGATEKQKFTRGIAALNPDLNINGIVINSITESLTKRTIMMTSTRSVLVDVSLFPQAQFSPAICTALSDEQGVSSSLQASGLSVLVFIVQQPILSLNPGAQILEKQPSLDSSSANSSNFSSISIVFSEPIFLLPNISSLQIGNDESILFQSLLNSDNAQISGQNVVILLPSLQNLSAGLYTANITGNCFISVKTGDFANEIGAWEFVVVSDDGTYSSEPETAYSPIATYNLKLEVGIVIGAVIGASVLIVFGIWSGYKLMANRRNNSNLNTSREVILRETGVLNVNVMASTSPSNLRLDEDYRDDEGGIYNGDDDQKTTEMNMEKWTEENQWVEVMVDSERGENE